MSTRKGKQALTTVVYKSAEAFFESQCKYGYTALKEGSGIVAIVLDSRKEFGTSVAVKTQPSGNQLATVKVASEDGGFITFAETLSAGGDRLDPGDLVIWIAGSYLPELAESIGDARSAWMGLIVAKIAAESDLATNEFTVICRY